MTKLFHTVKLNNEYCEEGYFRGKIGRELDKGKAMADEVAGWFKDPMKKKKEVNDLADSLLNWLDEKDDEYPHLDLEPMLVRISDKDNWRHQYMLDDEIYNKILKDIEANDNTQIEVLLSFNIVGRVKILLFFNKVTRIKELKDIVKKYKQRSNKVFDAIRFRQKSIKGVPFQVLLIGMGDLEILVKEIVNVGI